MLAEKQGLAAKGYGLRAKGPGLRAKGHRLLAKGYGPGARASRDAWENVKRGRECFSRGEDA